MELADRQHRVVATRQLIELGLGEEEIRSLVKLGWLTRVHRGVYAVGTRRLTRHGRWMAAVLACGDGAALSCRAAAELWGFHDGNGSICVTVPTHAGRRPRGGFRVRRSTDFDWTVHRRIPLTTVAWTLVDIAAELSRPELLRAADEAERQRLWSWDMFDEIAAGRRGDRGMGRLAQARAIRDPLAVKTRSELERQFLAICRRFSLPRPEVDLELLEGRYYADFLWEDVKLIVETDGRETHGITAAFESDRDRDTALAAFGYQTLRFSWRKIFQEPGVVADRLRRTLRARGSTVA